MEITAEDLGGIEYILVDIDGASAVKQRSNSFSYTFDVGYSRFFGKGWDISVEVMDGNSNIGEAEYHINSLWEGIYDLLEELALKLKKLADGLYDIWPYYKLEPFPAYYQGIFGLCAALSCLEIAEYYFMFWESLLTVQIRSKQAEYVENMMIRYPDNYTEKNKWIHNGMYLKTEREYLQSIGVYEKETEDDLDFFTDLGLPTFNELKSQIMSQRDPVFARFEDYYSKGEPGGHAVVIVGFYNLPWGKYGIIRDTNDLSLGTYGVSWDYLMDHLKSFIYVDGIGQAG